MIFVFIFCFVLAVQADDTFLNRPISMYPCENACNNKGLPKGDVDFSMLCVARGHPYVEIRWYLNNIRIIDSEKYAINSSMTLTSTRSNLKVSNPEKSDKGKWTCKAVSLAMKETTTQGPRPTPTTTTTAPIVIESTVSMDSSTTQNEVTSRRLPNQDEKTVLLAQSILELTENLKVLMKVLCLLIAFGIAWKLTNYAISFCFVRSPMDNEEKEEESRRTTPRKYRNLDVPLISSKYDLESCCSEKKTYKPLKIDELMTV